MENCQLNNVKVNNLLILISHILKNPNESHSYLLELRDTIRRSPCNQKLQDIQQYIIVAVSHVIKTRSGESRKVSCLLVELLHILFEKTKVTNTKTFLFAYNFIIAEIYNNKDRNVHKVSEEYKLAVVQTITLLFKALTWTAFQELYTRENILFLSPMLFVLISLAKYEQLRALRIAAIECIIAFAQVGDSADVTDIQLRNQVADVFMFYFPGIVQGLWEIALEDEVRGHAVAMMAVRAWGRITTLQMQNYNAADDLITQLDFEMMNIAQTSMGLPQCKWKDMNEASAYLQASKRTPAWYKETDNKLQALAGSFVKLTRHSHSAVRLELMRACLLLVEYCSVTIPRTTGKIIEILIILSEDEEQEISNSCRVVLSTVSDKFFNPAFKALLDNVEENFYGAITSMPRMFNSLNKKEQLSSLNLLSGYMRLFGKSHLAQTLHSPHHLKRLIETLIHFSELENKDISLCEEYMIQDLDLIADHHTPWKKFRYICDDTVLRKLEETCALLAQCNVLDVTVDLLLAIFLNKEERAKEATLILNNVLSGVKGSAAIEDSMDLISQVVSAYLDPDYWNLPLEVSYNCMLPQVKNNIIQICLQVEGLSKIALAIKKKYKQFLLKTLYPILERAGSGHPLIKAAGNTAIANISASCGYRTITALIYENADYFSFHVVRKIQKAEHNESVLNVLAMVMKYSDSAILDAISVIIQGVLLQTCDKFFQERNANAYLRVFQMFVKCLTNWFDIDANIQPIKSKQQRRLEHEDFKISNLLPDDGKAAEETYKGGVEKKQQEFLDEEDEGPINLEEDENVPSHVQLAVCLLERCLNFMPSKDRSRKILVLEILRDGLEIVRDWENLLLPLVHHIWSPLVDRFKEKDDPLVINYSFQLLVTLARVSKDFIRSRTVKDVLPHIRKTVADLSQLSYLKDAGSAYRYTQAYKLQLTVLQQLARAMTDMDLPDESMTDVMKVVFPYLSDKQPLPLQEAAVGFFCDIAKFDVGLVEPSLQTASNEDKLADEMKKNVQTVLQRMR